MTAKRAKRRPPTANAREASSERSVGVAASAAGDPGRKGHHNRRHPERSTKTRFLLWAQKRAGGFSVKWAVLNMLFLSLCIYLFVLQVRDIWQKYQQQRTTIGIQVRYTFYVYIT